MSLKVITGNIFTSNCQVIVNTVNCVGVMGAGIALECRLRYPEMHEKYIELCDKNQIDIGLLWIFKATDKWILNFPTKKHWKYPSKVEYLHQGLQKFVSTYKEREITSIAFPLLGADKGGIPQEESLKLLEDYLSPLEIDIEIYRYSPKASDDLYDRTKAWLLSQSIDMISEQTKLRKNYIQKVVDAMGDTSFCQLNQLGRVEGIGIKTLEKLFNFAQEAQENGTAHIEQQSLF